MAPVTKPSSATTVSDPAVPLAFQAITFYGRDESEPIVVPPSAQTLDGFFEYTLHMK